MSKIRRKQLEKFGDLNAWPFISIQEYQNCREKNGGKGGSSGICWVSNILVNYLWLRLFTRLLGLKLIS